jgi:hypothetical protein
VGRKAGHQHGYEEEAHAEQVVRKLATADRMLNSALGYQAPAVCAAARTHE